MPKQQSIRQTKANKSEDILRFVINEAGEFVYGSNSFLDYVGQDKTSLRNIIADEAIDFADSDAFAVSNAFMNPGNEQSKIASVRPGRHQISFDTGSKKTRKRNFHLDWISHKDGQRFLVGSSDIREGFNNEDSLEKILSKVSNNQQAINNNDKVPTRLKETETVTFMHMSNELQAVISQDGNFQRFNSNFNRILGYEDAEIADKIFLNLIHPDDRSFVKNALFAISGENYTPSAQPLSHFETRMDGANGGLFWIDWQIKNINGTIYALGRDITEIKNNEQVLTHREQQLREAQGLAKMGHWRWIIGERNIECSEQVFKIFNQSPDSFKPCIDSITKLLHRRDIGRVIQAFERAIIEKRNYDIDFRIYKDDGSTRFVRCEGRCEFDDDGEVIALFGIMQDETERLQHERALHEAKEAAEHAYASKSRFLANMSHELRTPLNAIIGFSEMMQRQLLGPIGTEKYLDYIAGIRESGEHLLDLISDILDMSKIEAGKYELDIERINLVKVGRLALHMMEGRALDAGIKLQNQIESDDIPMEADRRAIMQIMLNLLSNSLKFTEAGGSVKLKLNTNKENAIITVSDSGIGIPSNKLATITKPFEQVENDYSRQYEGSGLGLAITKDLTELHKGSVKINSVLGEGTDVIIKIPLKAKV